jgi:SAM-dependent methyltransferase
MYRRYHTHEPEPATPPTLATSVEFLLLDAVRGIELGAPRAKESPLSSLLGRLLRFVPLLRDRAVLSHGGFRARPGGRILDVGAGSGIFVARLRALGWDAVGVEPDPTAAAGARSRHGGDVRTGTLEEQRLPDGSFDAVHLSHVLEHVHEPGALLRECRRVLRPGGRLVVLTPNAESLGHRLQGRGWRGLEPPRHLHVFTSRSLRRALRDAGFRAEVRSTARLAGETWAAGAPGAPRAAALLFAGAEELWRAFDRSCGEELAASARPAPSAPLRTPSHLVS